MLGLVGEGHLHHPGDVSRGRLHPDGVGRDELRGERGGLQVPSRGEGPAPRPGGRLAGVAHLAPHEHVPEHDLQPVEEVVADDNHGGAARGPALPGADGLDAGGGSWEAGEDPGQGTAPRWGLGVGQGWARGPDLRRGLGVVPYGHAWSCYARTCCRTQPARAHPRSPSWTPPPVGRAKASLEGAKKRTLCWGK